MRLFPLLVAMALAKGVSAGPLVSLFTTCTTLARNFYPADTVNWFEPARNPQIVLYAHMLFPLLEEGKPGAWPADWHPPLVAPRIAPPADAFVAIKDEYYAEAIWTDPDGVQIASHGLTMPARVSTDYERIDGKTYIPHTFTHTIGTRDLRASAGQTGLPLKAGQYHIRLKVDGEAVGLAFFRMLSGSQPLPQATALPTPLSQTVRPK